MANHYHYYYYSKSTPVDRFGCMNALGCLNLPRSCVRVCVIQFCLTCWRTTRAQTTKLCYNFSKCWRVFCVCVCVVCLSALLRSARNADVQMVKEICVSEISAYTGEWRIKSNIRIIFHLNAYRVQWFARYSPHHSCNSPIKTAMQWIFNSKQTRVAFATLAIQNAAIGKFLYNK